MKKMNKVIAAMTVMAITIAMPVMAGTKNHEGHNKKTTTIIVANTDKTSHFDKLEKKVSHVGTQKKSAYRPDIKTCTFKVSRHASPHSAVAKAERIHGVMNAYWNPRTHEMTVRYDARITSASHIRHAVA